MIKRENELKVDHNHEMRGGKLTTVIQHFMTEEESGGIGKTFGIITIPPGGSIGYHQHSGNFEVCRFLSGQATIIENDKSEHVLGPGDVNLCKDGFSHSIENRGTEDLVFVALVLHSK